MSKPLRLLIAGFPTTGKTTSLMYFEKPERVFYLNLEGKDANFPSASKFKKVNAPIIDPYDVFALVQMANERDDIDIIVIDGFSFLMQMFEQTIVNKSNNKQGAWGKYTEFVVDFMQQYVAPSPKDVIITAHNEMFLNQETELMEYRVALKGAAGKLGFEAYFDNIVYTRSVALKDLTKYGEYDPELIHIDPEEEVLGAKYVFQLKRTKESLNTKIRHTFGLWNAKQIYMDNNAQLLLNKMREFFNN